jgi:diguanylate cyclase (GGDEF)-like protein
VAEYCGFRLHRYLVKVPLVFISSVIVLLFWTNKYHGLIYAEYDLYKSWQHILIARGGKLYFAAQCYSFLLMLGVACILVYSLVKYKKKFRKQFIIMLIALLFPIAAQFIHQAVILAFPGGFMAFFTPHSMALTNLVIYLGLIRNNALDIIPGATITAMEHAKEAFLLADAGDRYLSSNAALHKFFPGVESLTMGDPVTAVENWPQELAVIDQYEKPVYFDVAPSNPGEKKRYFEASISPVYGKKGEIRAKIILMRDVTQVTELVEQLRLAAYTDMLTGIFNRRHFLELAEMNFERADRSGDPLCFAMFDLDHFKNVNDTWGHEAGDKVLQNFAAILKQSVRPYDIVGRFGGEEFVIVTVDINLDNARQLIERVRTNVEASSVEYNGVTIRVTCSAGIAEYRKGEAFYDLVRRADRAMYEAKESGRNRVCLAS